MSFALDDAAVAKKMREEFTSFMQFIACNDAFDPLSCGIDAIEAVWECVDPQRAVHGGKKFAAAMCRVLQGHPPCEDSNPLNCNPNAKNVASDASEQEAKMASFSVRIESPLRTRSTGSSPHRNALAGALGLSLLRQMAKPFEASTALLSPSMMSLNDRPPVRFTDILLKATQSDGKMINQYLVLDDIGRGAQGKVKLVFDTQKEEFRALKVMKRPKVAHIGAKHEIAVLKKLRHQSIVALHEVIDDPATKKIYLVLQYVERGALSEAFFKDGELMCKTIDPCMLIHYALQITSGLKYLHRHQVAHRDIKPDNILLGNNDNVYITDFGVAELLADDGSPTSSGSGSAMMKSRRTASIGTPAFHAPCLIDENSNADEVDGAALDVWSLGVTLFMLLTGRLPWSSKENENDAYPSWETYRQRILNDPVQFPPSMPLPWQSVLSCMLAKHPQERCSLSVIRAKLKGLECTAAHMPQRLREKIVRASTFIPVEEIDKAESSMHTKTHPAACDIGEAGAPIVALDSSLEVRTATSTSPSFQQEMKLSEAETVAHFFGDSECNS